MENIEKFDHLSSKFGQLLYGRREADKNHISKILDELNSLNYLYPVVENSTKTLLLINNCCSYISPEDSILVPKCCQLLANLIEKQAIRVEGRTLSVSIQWCLQAVKAHDRSVLLNILKALESLLRNNAQNVVGLIDTVVSTTVYHLSREIKEKHDNYQEIILACLQCLECCTNLSNDAKSHNVSKLFPCLEKCAQVFTSLLCVKNVEENSIAQSKILETCLVGLKNITYLHPEYLKKDLGQILGIIKSYMLYNINDVDFISPEKLMPSTLSVPEVPVQRERTGGKQPKLRKQRTPGIHNKKKETNKKISENTTIENKGSNYVPATTNLEYNSDSFPGQSFTAGLKTSDSDFSDNEGGQRAKLNRSYGKVRQAALNLFYNVIKCTEKPVIFSYWTSFIPESSSSGKHNLVTCFSKDPSIRGRMCALNALLALIVSCKMYLMQAETNDKTSSFTPFSVALGLTLIELHRNLILCLNHRSVPVIALTCKCLAALVQATPYQKMGKGLISKIVRNVKDLIYHRDASVQVTALIVLGCILALEPVLSETKEALTKPRKDVRAEHVKSEEETSESNNKSSNDIIESVDFDYARFSSDEEDMDNGTVEVDSISWLLKRCLSNLGVSFVDKEEDRQENKQEKMPPIPVKLESVQVLSVMSRNFFESTMVRHLSHVTRALELSLSDKCEDLKLHAGRAVDFIGQNMNKVAESDGCAACLNFWQTLLGGSLDSLLQNEQNALLRSVGCDCIGSIGPHIYQQLPRDKQLLCVYLLFSCSKDEDNTVRGAAIRSLALCVLYPCLREDPGFVVDTAVTILQGLKDDNFVVKTKASWSLGNLSEALVLNSKSVQCADDKLPESILLKLLESAIKGTAETDNVKTNIFRGIGNLVQLLDEELLKKEQFKIICEQAIGALVNGCTSGTNMKVRWNACYALGNILKNPSLYTSLDACAWQPMVFNTLNELVVGFKNFKVRIHSALALSVPATRKHYGQFFIPVWSSLLKALENSQNMDDFSEYKHRDHLVDQICISLAHLTTLLTKEDLNLLDNSMNLYFDTFKSLARRVSERLLPEKSTELFSASSFLSNWEAQSDVYTENERRIIECLKDVFVAQF